MKIKELLNEFFQNNEKINNMVQIATYDGGNDSGYLAINEEFELFLKENNISDDEIYIFINYLENNLDYGTWAGDFEANGIIYWNGNKFVVQGYESSWESFNKEFKFDIN